MGDARIGYYDTAKGTLSSTSGCASHPTRPVVQIQRPDQPRDAATTINFFVWFE